MTQTATAERPETRQSRMTAAEFGSAKAPSQKQLRYARTIAGRTGTTLPWETQLDRFALSRWISRNQPRRSKAQPGTQPTSKQIDLAERLSRAKHRAIPAECLRSRDLLSKWIDANKG